METKRMVAFPLFTGNHKALPASRRTQ